MEHTDPWKLHDDLMEAMLWEFPTLPVTLSSDEWQGQYRLHKLIDPFKIREFEKTLDKQKRSRLQVFLGRLF